jgi:murein L,D-transpeptidase YafK
MILMLAVVCAITFAQTSDSSREVVPMLGELKQPEIIIRKKRRTLEVYDNGKLVKTFSMVLGFAPTGDKEAEGDGRTPEGEFYVFTKNPDSKFHLSLGLSYPSKDDAARGFSAGVITRPERDAIVSAIDSGKMPPQKTALGGEIYIHGGGTDRDWTWGCVALTNEEIEEIFKAIPVGTKVTIKP